MKAVLVGATGVVGSAALEHFLERGADVVTVSRRRPHPPGAGRFEHLAIDLLDREATRSALGALRGVTHVVYAALFEKPGLIAGWVDPDQIENNGAMLRNVLDPLIASGAPLEHVSVLQGTKAYGFHVARMRVPAKERQPRVEHENFYWVQQDYLEAMSREHGWAHTIWRPQFIFGDAQGAAMNLIPVIGVYGALCRELGLPFSYPGGRSYIAEAVDSRLLAEALYWATDSPTARNQVFNITNGDVFEWRDLWPSFAALLGVEVGDDAPRSLAEWLPSHADTWARIAGREGLQQPDLLRLLGESHHYADNAFAWTPDGSVLASREHPVLLSTVKLRQAGFTPSRDTEDMFAFWIRRLQEQHVLPTPLASAAGGSSSG
jgi:nucleoside-diphosphate-sugar epimerase